ncbi:DUF4190 domain-containing protein [Mycolicibacterium sp. ND9-15]|uniref:DUF4190 domain-containing protein n=1 Tax=Mycolicibacterium sp. ND9-15 TaxID=3042320 RepID=UPI002DDBA423|nr:DUF4190 domain-containing protein [Mycolicibacterium sp. ND9-15]WSE55382.1 DUF4190 domain-containing protein [Mycolicibacterium sp. ND9-15]
MAGPHKQPFQDGDEERAWQKSPPVDYPADPGLPPAVYPPSYGPAAGYAYAPVPYDPYRGMKPQGTNGIAVAALVISLVSLVFCGLPSIIGLILGIIAMRDTRRSGQDGYGLALAGVIISGIPIVLWVLYWLFFVVLFAGSFTFA